MDFFQYQEDARKRTKLLIFYYALAVAMIIAGVYAVLILGMAFSGNNVQTGGAPPPPPPPLWQPELLLWTVLGVGGIIGLGTLVKIATLSGGGKSVAEMMGGTPIAAETSDFNERKLLNVVEEMAIASGTPVPPVYIIEEEGINAFAAGFHASDAVIGVTRGCAEKLDRDELQGVIAHEFSHILNGDMRLNIRLIGVLFGILLITVCGRMLLRIGFYSGMGGRRRSSGNGKGNNGLPLLLLGIALLIIGAIGVFFGRLIKSAVSRQREFLADAAAVQFTRNPDGLAGALKKIGGYTSQLQSVHAEEASHMFFANSLKSSLGGLLATHPPLETRIQRLDAQFKHNADQAAADSATAAGHPNAAVSGLAGETAAHDNREPRISAHQVTAGIGTLQAQSLDRATRLIKTIPESVRSAVRTPHGARAAVYCLLFTEEQQALEKQQQCLNTAADQAALDCIPTLRDPIADLPPGARMPLVDLAMTALQQQGVEQYRRFKQTVEELIDADNHVGIFEFALSRSLMRNLDPVFGRPEAPNVSHTRLSAILPHCLPLLAFLARYGNENDPEQAAADFAAGLAELDGDPQRTAMPAPDSDPVQAFQQSLSVLRRANGPLKKRVVAACVSAVLGNRNVTAREADLLRAVADSLDCPLPPLVT